MKGADSTLSARQAPEPIVTPEVLTCGGAETASGVVGEPHATMLQLRRRPSVRIGRRGDFIAYPEKEVLRGGSAFDLSRGTSLFVKSAMKRYKSLNHLHKDIT